MNINGDTITLEHGPYAANLATVGAAVRTLTYEGRDLVVPFGEDELRPAYRGVLLAPWPNRVVDGMYAFDGVTYELPINERNRNHALHGLICDQGFDVASRTASSATLTSTIHARGGYPFTIGLEVLFELGDDGLTTTVTATNLGAARAPYGTGPHPYLAAGTPNINGCTLTLPAATVYEVEPERLTPVALVDVAASDGGALDFRETREIGTQFIDHAYSGLALAGDGTCEVRLVAPDGRGARMVWDGRVLPVGPDPHRRPPRAGVQPARPRRGAHDLPAGRLQPRHRPCGDRAGREPHRRLDDRRDLRPRAARPSAGIRTQAAYLGLRRSPEDLPESLRASHGKT